MNRPEVLIADACELELDRHGDSFRGAGYTRSPDEPNDQYAVMLGVVRGNEPAHILDLGCGLAHLADFIAARPALSHLRYTGLDISEKFIAAASARRGDLDLLRMNLLESDADLGMFDYVVMNGIFNYRGPVSFEAMADYWKQMIGIAFRHACKGIAFNVMSKIVDWERDDLFHLPFDMMAAHVAANLSRHFTVRHDYGRFEYTVYVYRDGFRYG